MIFFVMIYVGMWNILNKNRGLLSFLGMSHLQCSNICMRVSVSVEGAEHGSECWTTHGNERWANAEVSMKSANGSRSGSEHGSE